MFCPHCGTANQNENAYCRHCGEYLPALKQSKAFAWGGTTPQQHVTTTLFLNALSAIASLVMGVLLLFDFVRRGDLPFLIALAGGLLLTIGLWQVSNFTIGLKLRRHFKKNEGSETGVSAQSKTVHTNELLTEARFEDVVPPSVVDNTTMRLHEKVPVRSSQPDR
jgi:hypothetical protein